MAAVFLVFAGWICSVAAVDLPGILPVRFGESVGVNALYEGKGLIRFGIAELDKNGKVLAKTMKRYSGRNCPDNRTFVAVIKNPKTVKVKAIYEFGKGSSFKLKHIKFSHLSKEMTKLYSVKANRKLWFERTKGVNLIAGKKLSFSPSTKSYPLTYKGGTDATDLTDGKFGRDDDQIWFDGRAVSWSDLRLNLCIIADLGEVQSVEKAVIRLVGGRIDAINGYTDFPPELEAWVSKDGKNYFLARRLKQLGPAEKADADWKTLYYLPQTADRTWPSYVYPFELTIQADARYVVIRSPRQHRMTSDEMAIIKAEKKDPAYNSAYKNPSVPLFHTTAILSPFYDKFYVAKDIYLPNLLGMDDKRPNRAKPFSYEIDLPSGVKLYNDPAPPWPKFTRIPQGSKTVNGRNIFRFGIKCHNMKEYDRYLKYGIGPFYFRAEGKVPAKDMYAEFRTYEDGKHLYTKRFPLEILTIKPVPRLKQISVGPAFFFEWYLKPWPEFHKTMRTLGFNTLRFDFLAPLSEKRYKQFYADGVKAGFMFRGQMSCTMYSELYAQRDKANVRELYCQYPANKKFSPHNMCPSYRGKYYQKVLGILREGAKKYPMKYISFDEEAWCRYRSGDSFTFCTRCDALRKSKGMTWKEFIPWVQMDYLSGFYKAVKGVKNPPQVGYYSVHPDHIIGNSTVGPIPFNGFNLLYPKYCDEIQPSTYSPDTRLVHTSTRRAYIAAGKQPRRLHRWLSAGSGAYSSQDYGRHSTYQVLEAVMNGSAGIQYYYFQSFRSPRDYAYVADGLRAIAPYEDILMNGSMDLAFKGSNKGLYYTARNYKNQTLVLVGNYAAVRDAATVLPLKGRVTDIFTGKKYNAKGSFRCIVPADSCRFFLVEK